MAPGVTSIAVTIPHPTVCIDTTIVSAIRMSRVFSGIPRAAEGWRQAMDRRRYEEFFVKRKIVIKTAVRCRT